VSDHISDQEDAIFGGFVLRISVVDFNVTEHFELAFGFAFVLDALVAT
jgi:hypothetical protein